MDVHEMYHVVANGLSAILSLPEEALERQFGIRPSEGKLSCEINYIQLTVSFKLSPLSLSVLSLPVAET